MKAINSEKSLEILIFLGFNFFSKNKNYSYSMNFRSRPFSCFTFLVTFLSAFLFANISTGCGYSGARYVGYSILHPGISESPTQKPFMFTYTYHKDSWAWEENNMDKNILEWKNYFCGKPTIDDLKFIIYKSSIQDLEQLKTLQTNAKAAVPDTLKNSSFIKIFSQYKFPDFLDYLIFSKKCEPHFTRYNFWRKEEPRAEAIPALIKKGIKNYQTVQNDFLKLRYGFQILRLTWYANQNVELAYQQFIEPLQKVKSIIQNRSLERLGGWLAKSENQEKSIHGKVLLVKSLIGGLDRAEEVFLGFSIENQKEWDQVMAACENDEQRSIIHYLRALDQHSIALEDMKAIYQLHPTSKVLEILMTREMQKIELRVLEQKVNTVKDWGDKFIPEYGIPQQNIYTYLKKVQSFTKKIITEKKSKNIAFWMMMNGYFEYLSNRHHSAEKIYAQAKKEDTSNPVLFDQIELLEFANLLHLRNSIDAAMEIQFAKIMKNNKAFVKQNSGEPDFFMEKMASIYARNGAIAKAYLCDYDIYGLKFFPNSQDAAAVLELYDKTNKNEFEKYLIQDDHIKTRKDIVDILGTAYLGEHQIDLAIQTFQTIPNFGKKFYDPFITYIFPNNIKKKHPEARKLSKLEIAKKIKSYENEITQNSVHAAAAHLALGNFHYNASYFGYGWEIKDYFITITSWYGKDYKFRYYGYYDNTWAKGNKEFMDLSVARKHLKKVYELSADKELEARATLMLAEFEKINNHLKEIRDESDKKYRSKYYLTFLEDNYFETQFYEKYLRECAPYDSY